MRSTALLLALLAGLATACGSSGAGSSGAAVPGSAGHAWRQMRSAHFLLQTDQDDGDGAKALREMESLHGVLSSVLFPGDDASLAIRVVGFQSKADYESFAHRGALAYVAHGLPFTLEYEPTIVYFGEMLEQQKTVLAHEITHALIGRRFPGMPTWLNEGFAEYAETVELRGGDAYFGRSREDGRFWLKQGLPSLQALRRMKPSEFYARRTGETRKITRDEELALASHYAAAWGAVHMFSTGERRYAEPFADYVKDLSLGVRDEDAWAKAFAGIPEAELQQAFELHMARGFGIKWKTPYESEDYAGPLEVHAMTPGEALVLQGALAAGAGQIPRAEGLVRSATETDPTSARAWWARSLLTKMPDREAYLRKALALAPTDGNVIASLLDVLARKSGPNGPRSEEEQRLLEALAQHASEADHFNTVAWVKAHDGKAAVALAFAKKSVALAPMCAACIDTLAYVAHEKGDLPAALKLQRRAVSLLGEGRRDPSYERTLQAYEEEARSKGVAGAAKR